MSQFNTPLPPEEEKRQEALRAGAAQWAAGERAKREAAERQAAKEQAEAEDKALCAALLPGWLLANPTAREADFDRLWPLLKEEYRRRQEADAFQKSLAAKAGSEMYAEF